MIRKIILPPAPTAVTVERMETPASCITGRGCVGNLARISQVVYLSGFIRVQKIGEIPNFGIFPVFGTATKTQIRPGENVPSVEKPAKIYSTKWRPKVPFSRFRGGPRNRALCTIRALRRLPHFLGDRRPGAAPPPCAQ